MGSEGNCGTDTVPEPARILGGDEALLLADSHVEDPAFGEERRKPGVERALGQPIAYGCQAVLQLALRQISDAEEQVVQAIGASRAVGSVEALQLEFQLAKRIGVENLPKVGLAEELAELLGVYRERLGPPFRERRIPLVEVVADIAEEQRGRKGRGCRPIHRQDSHLSASDATKELHEGRKVEDVLEALAKGLEDDWKRPITRGNQKEVGSPLALHPEGRPLPRATTGKEQRAACRLAEVGGKESGTAQRPDHEVLDFLGFGEEQCRVRRTFGLREAPDDPVVRGHGLGPRPSPLSEGGAHGKGPGGVNSTTPRREQADAEVPHLVLQAFEDEGPVVRHGAGGVALLVQVLEEAGGCGAIQTMVGAKVLFRCLP
jgi:hypothetical protein